MIELLHGPGVGWVVFAVSFGVIVMAAIAQSTIGIGFGIVAAPVLAVVDPTMVPGPILFLAMLTSLMVLIRDFRDLNLSGLGYALGGRVVASLLGGLTASLLSEQAFMLLFAGLILAAVALSVSGLKLPPSNRNLLIAGSASGYMGTITSVGTPPMAIVYQHTPGREVRANMSAFLTVGALVSIGSLATFGAFTMTHLAHGLALIPALVVGFWLSGPLKAYTDRGWMRPAMLILCVAAAATLIVRAVA